MTQAELHYLGVMPNRLLEIERQLEELNKTMATIAKVLNERK